MNIERINLFIIKEYYYGFRVFFFVILSVCMSFMTSMFFPANASVFFPDAAELSEVHRESDFLLQDNLEYVLALAESGEDYIQIDDMRFKIDRLVEHDAFLGNRWTDGIVYYEFDANVDATNQQRWLDAAAEWSAVASLIFEERTTQANYIYIMSDSGNWSEVGMTGGQQEMGIYNWTWQFIIAHEIGHALGLKHEQSRSDRDSYIDILTENIDPAKIHNFEIAATASYGSYDFDSVMHYPKAAFSINGGNTIEPLPAYSSWLDLIGQRDHLSDLDQSGMAARYGALSSDDAYEENDTQGTAYDLSSHEGVWLSSIAGNGIQADEDWYKIYVPAGSSQLLIDLRFTDADGDIDLRLYDSSGATLSSSTSTSDDEYIAFTPSLSGGEYWLKVYYDDAGNSYDLWWDADDAYEGNDTQGTAYDLSSHEGVWLSSIAGDGIQADEDWYKVYVPAGSSQLLIDLRFTHADGDIDLRLYDSSGASVGYSGSITDDESIDFIPPSSGGEYWLKVYFGNGGNSYDLWWDAVQGNGVTIAPILMLLLNN